MPKFIIEREVPEAGKMTAEELRQGSLESLAVVNEIGPKELQWVTTYYTDNKIYCMFIAKDTDVLLEHARCLDIPADRITRVVSQTDPTTAE